MASGKNRAFITVDVECHELAKRNLYLEGKIGNEYWGLEKILQVLFVAGIIAIMI